MVSTASIRNPLTRATTYIFRYPDNRVTSVVHRCYFASDNFQFIRPVSTAASQPDKQAGRRLTIAKKSGNKSPKTTHGRNLFDRAGGKRDAFEYVDWVVAHKSLLEALWDSAMEAMGEEDEEIDEGGRAGGERGERGNLGQREEDGRRGGGAWTREEPRCYGFAGRVEAAGCASATWRGSARHWNCKCVLWIFPYRGSNASPGLLQRFSLFLILFASPPLRSLSRLLLLVLSFALSSCSFTRHTQFILSHRYLTLFHHIFAYSHIPLVQLPPSRSHIFSLILFLFSGILCPCSSPSSLCKTEMHTLESVHAVALISVFHSCLTLTFPQDRDCSSSLFYRFPSSFPNSYFVLPLLYHPLIFHLPFSICLLFFSHSKRCRVFSYASCYERQSKVAHPIYIYMYIVILCASQLYLSSLIFIVTTLSLFWFALITIVFIIILSKTLVYFS